MVKIYMSDHVSFISWKTTHNLGYPLDYNKLVASGIHKSINDTGPFQQLYDD